MDDLIIETVKEIDKALKMSWDDWLFLIFCCVGIIIGFVGIAVALYNHFPR